MSLFLKYIIVKVKKWHMFAAYNYEYEKNLFTTK